MLSNTHTITSRSISNRISINIKAVCFLYFRRTTSRFLCPFYPCVMVNTWFRKAEDEFTHLFLLNVNENILEYFPIHSSYFISLQTKIILFEILYLKGFHNSALSDLMPLYLPVGRYHLSSLDNTLTTLKAFLSCSSVKVCIFSITIPSEIIFWPNTMTEPLPNMLSQINVC